ncbi:glycosyltransferase [Pantoea sp. FN0307]|uniref:glycosyltransferase n=1 Tax=Pantoea sp. FN0307 TaxID=3418560 RepID=UPI003CF70AEA
MSNKPLLSLIIAVYNGEKFLATFFTSIEQQSLSNYELIVVNDGSTDVSAKIIATWQSKFDAMQVINQSNQGVSVARNSGMAAATGKYIVFPDIDDKIYPGIYLTLLDMAEKGALDVATCNGRYVYQHGKARHSIFPLERLYSTPVLLGPVWLKQALDPRKFLHVTCLNIYCHDFLTAHNFIFEPGLRHQDNLWTTGIFLTSACVQYTDQIFYDHYIHSESVSHEPDTDETLMCSARPYMKIIYMLDQINRRHIEQTRSIRACRWQIAKEGPGIIHTFDNMQEHHYKHLIIKEFFDKASWNLIWRYAQDLRLRWCLSRRYLRLRKALIH